MKKIMFILICHLLAGCCSQRFEYFNTRFNLPTEEVSVTPYIQTSHKSTGIPFIAWREKRGAPYSLVLNFLSKNEPHENVSLAQIKLIDTEGTAHQLLDKKVMVDSFKIRQYGASHATIGSYYGKVFESKWTIKDIPLKFTKDSSCTVEIKYSVGDKTHEESWQFNGLLRKKTQSVIGYVKNY